MQEPKITVDKEKNITKVEYGKSGTYIIGGIISQVDPNPKLDGRHGVKIFDKMRKTDASVRASLKAMKLPILGANWYVEAASEDGKDKEVAEFVRWCLFDRMEMSFRDFLRQALTMLDFGFSVFEKVFDVDGGKIVWKKFAPRLQHTIISWETEGGEKGITQMLPTGERISIPMEKLLIFTNEKEGDNWYGVSEIRSAYQPYFSKDLLYRIDSVAHERQGVGIPYVKIPQNAEPQEEAEAERLVQNMYANEQAYIKLKEGWEFGFIDMKGGGTRQQTPSILHHDRQIAKNVLAQFLDLGAGGTGSFALSKDQSSLFLLSLEATAQQIAEIVTKYAIRQLVDFNFSVDRYPTLRVNKIGQKNYQQLMSAVSQGIQIGVIRPDKKLEKYLRDVMELPDPDEEEQAEQELVSFLQEQTEWATTIEEGEEEQTIQGAWGRLGEGLSEEHKRKISEALKEYWSNKKTEKPAGGKKKGKTKEQTQAEQEKKKAKSEFQSFLMEQRMKLLERRARGEKITQEEAASVQLEILKRRKELEERIAAIDQAKKMSETDGVAEIKGVIDDAIEWFESCCGGEHGSEQEE